MKVQTKLLIAITMPLLLTGVFASILTWGNYVRATNLNESHELATFSTTASSLVHEVQKERGLTAGFLGEGGNIFRDQLSEQRLLTDAKLAEFQSSLESLTLSVYGEDFSSQVNDCLEELEFLKDRRAAISSRKLSVGEAIGFYTRLNSLLLSGIGRAATSTTDGELAVRFSSYTSFLQSKERAGIERAVLANTFSNDRFLPGAFDKLTSLIALQEMYLQQFSNTATPESRQRFSQLREQPAFDNVERYRKIAQEKAEVGGFGQDPDKWFQTATVRINHLKDFEDELANEMLAIAESKSRSARNSALIALILTTIVALGVGAGGYFSVRSVVGQVKEVTSRIRGIADGDGDLTKRLAVSQDEFGELAKWFNVMLDKIESVVVAIASTSDQLSDSSTRLIDTAEQLIGGANSSKQQSSTIAAAAEQMSMNMRNTAAATDDTARRITEVTNSIASIRSSIQEVEQHSGKAASISRSAKERVESGNSQIAQLGMAANEIGDVIDVIQDIAEQTNLLALNATIEAARAGDSGKGFAVVATEVKELARQTSDATEGIRKRVMTMQQCTDITVETMTDIDRVMKEVNEVASTIDESIGKQSQEVVSISDWMDQSADGTKAMALGINEAATVTAEITRSVAGVDGQLQSTLEGAGDTKRAGDVVAELARSLRSQVGRFKTRS